MLKAIVFDFDGVIVDTEKLHHEAFIRSAPEGIPVPDWAEYQVHYIGFDDRDAFRTMHAAAGIELSDDQLPELIERKARVFHELVEVEGPELYPGVAELIRLLHGRVGLGLATGSLRSDVEPIIGPSGLIGCFDVIVTADDVSASKPDPESYEKAAAGLAAHYADRDIQPSDCAAIEDTPFGLAAAREAGLFTVGVSNTHAAAELDLADRVVASLEPAEEFLAQVERWMREGPAR